MMKLTVVVIIYIIQCGLVSPSVENDGPGGVEYSRSTIYRGHRKLPFASYVANGQTARKGQFPYQVRLRNTQRNNIGDGAIISRKHVLTTARCIIWISGSNSCPPKNIIVQAGTANVREDPNIEEFQAQETICHNAYDPKYRINNIAIITIKETFTFTPYIKPLKMTWRFPGPDVLVTISGWSGRQLTVLKFGQTTNIRLATCRRLLEKERPPSAIHASKGCVHSNAGLYVDGGYLGGPIVHDGNLIGVLSNFWTRSSVATFMKVEYHRKWIEGIVGDLLDESYERYGAQHRGP